MTLAGLTAAAVVGLARLFRTPAAFAAPVALAGLGAHATGWASRRARLRASVGALLARAAGTLAATWTVLGRTTVMGLPTLATWRVAHHQLAVAAGAIRTSTVPVAPLAGFELAAAAGVVGAAMLADWAPPTVLAGHAQAPMAQTGGRPRPGGRAAC